MVAPSQQRSHRLLGRSPRVQTQDARMADTYAMPSLSSNHAQVPIVTCTRINRLANFGHLDRSVVQLITTF